jgi:hypothetical protein
VKALFWVGLVILILGLASLVVPIPRTDRESLTVGGVLLAVEAQHQEKLSPFVSGVMILGGLGAMAAGRRKTS